MPLPTTQNPFGGVDVTEEQLNNLRQGLSERAPKVAPAPAGTDIGAILQAMNGATSGAKMPSPAPAQDRGDWYLGGVQRDQSLDNHNPYYGLPPSKMPPPPVSADVPPEQVDAAVASMSAPAPTQLPEAPSLGGAREFEVRLPVQRGGWGVSHIMGNDADRMKLASALKAENEAPATVAGLLGQMMNADAQRGRTQADIYGSQLANIGATNRSREGIAAQKELATMHGATQKELATMQNELADKRIREAESKQIEDEAYRSGEAVARGMRDANSKGVVIHSTEAIEHARNAEMERVRRSRRGNVSTPNAPGDAVQKSPNGSGEGRTLSPSEVLEQADQDIAAALAGSGGKRLDPTELLKRAQANSSTLGPEYLTAILKQLRTHSAGNEAVMAQFLGQMANDFARGRNSAVANQDGYSLSAGTNPFSMKRRFATPFGDSVFPKGLPSLLETATSSPDEEAMKRFSLAQSILGAGR